MRNTIVGNVIISIKHPASKNIHSQKVGTTKNVKSGNVEDCEQEITKWGMLNQPSLKSSLQS